MKARLSWIVAGMLALTVGVSAVGAQEVPGDGGQEGRGGVRDIIALVSEATGLEPREILQQSGQGVSIAELIASNGGDVQTVTAAVIAAALERVDQAEANGRITPERAEELRTNIPTRVEQVIHGELRGHRLALAAMREVARLALEQTGLSRAELLQALRSGQSLGDILTANGISIDAFIADATNVISARLDALVTNGRITEEQRTQLLEQFTSRLTERLNRTGRVQDV